MSTVTETRDGVGVSVLCPSFFPTNLTKSPRTSTDTKLHGAAMRLVGFAYAGVAPDLMGLGPIPATERVLAQTGLSLDDIGLFELNEPFAVQVLTWCEGLGIAPDDPRLNPYGGAIACGHPFAATGIRLLAQLAHGFRERPDTRYGLTALCIGMGMGCAVLWENLQ